MTIPAIDPLLKLPSVSAIAALLPALVSPDELVGRLPGVVRLFDQVVGQVVGQPEGRVVGQLPVKLAGSPSGKLAGVPLGKLDVWLVDTPVDWTVDEEVEEWVFVVVD